MLVTLVSVLLNNSGFTRHIFLEMELINIIYKQKDTCWYIKFFPSCLFQPKHTEDTFPEYDGSYLILCLSITSGVSRIVCGKVADLKWVNRIRMQQFAFFILGVSTMCIPFSGSFWGLIVINLVMGICDGVFVCLLGPIAFDIVGPSEASQAIGFLLGIFSIPFTIGPPVAGKRNVHCNKT